MRITFPILGRFFFFHSCVVLCKTLLAFHSQTCLFCHGCLCLQQVLAFLLFAEHLCATLMPKVGPLLHHIAVSDRWAVGYAHRTGEVFAAR